MTYVPIPVFFAQRLRTRIDYIDANIGGVKTNYIDPREIPVSVGASIVAYEEFPEVRAALELEDDVADRNNGLILHAALAAWRRTQFIYQFDPDFAEALSRTSTDVVLNSDLIRRMPAPAIWVEDVNHPEDGCFVCLDRASDGFVLWMVMLVRCRTDGTIGDTEQTSNLCLSLDVPLQKSIDTMYARFDDERRREIASGVVGTLMRVLYLCSEEPDVDGHVSRMNMQRRARRQLPYGPTLHRVGFRFGAEFRKAAEDHAARSLSAGSPTHRSVAPHFRRAHWHTFWRGKRNGERHRVLRWLPPIAVNTQLEEPLAVGRVVKNHDPGE